MSSSSHGQIGFAVAESHALIAFESNASAVAESYESISKIVPSQAFALNSTALKWIRDTHEQPRGTPTTVKFDLTNKDPLMIGVLLRDKGMSYAFAPGQLQPWSWRQMLASFNETTKRQILGFDGGDGLVSITCEPLPKSYDHKRHHAARLAGDPFPQDAEVPIWDFVVRRANGMAIRFHPQLTNKKVEIASISMSPLQDPPAAGKGKSDGRGTYRFYKEAAYGGIDVGDPCQFSTVVDNSKSSMVVAAGSAANMVASVRPRLPVTNIGAASASVSSGAECPSAAVAWPAQQTEMSSGAASSSTSLSEQAWKPQNVAHSWAVSSRIARMPAAASGAAGSGANDGGASSSAATPSGAASSAYMPERLTDYWQAADRTWSSNSWTAWNANSWRGPTWSDNSWPDMNRIDDAGAGQGQGQEWRNRPWQ